MQGAGLAESQLGHIIKEDNRHEEDQLMESNGGSSVESGNDGTNGAVSLAYPQGATPLHRFVERGTNLFYLAYHSIADLIITMTGNDRDTSGEPIPCYCLPCLSCGRGEKGRSNVKTLLFLIVVPFFLLFFFLLDDFGHIIMKNMKARSAARFYSHNTPSSMFADSNTGEVNSFHFRRATLHAWPKHKRDVLIRRPEKFLSISGEKYEATLKCPRGLLFLFHGCQRYASSFFYSPQGRRIVAMALDAGLVVVAFTKNDEIGCWDWEKDGEAIKKLGQKFIVSRLAGICTDKDGSDIYPPIFGFGASSGGSILSMLASEMKTDPESFGPFIFSAMNIQIMAPPEDIRFDTPTVYTVMDGDGPTKKRVEEFVAAESMSGVPSQVIVTSGQKPIEPNHFSRVFQDDPQMTESISHQIHKDLVALSVIDPSTNHLTGDPRFSKDAVASVWQKYELRTRKEIAQNTKGVDAMAVTPFGVSSRLMALMTKEERIDSNSLWMTEELNVAWDGHEITAEGFGDVLSFFLKHSSTPWVET